MNDDILDVASGRISKAYAGQGVAIDPAIIAIIIGIIKNILAGCFQSGTDADSVKAAGPLRVRLAAMRALSNAGGSWFTQEGRKIVDAVVKVHAESSADEILKLAGVGE